MNLLVINCPITLSLQKYLHFKPDVVLNSIKSAVIVQILQDLTVYIYEADSLS